MNSHFEENAAVNSPFLEGGGEAGGCRLLITVCRKRSSRRRMAFLFLIASLLLCSGAHAQTFKMLTWNIANFGKEDTAKMKDIAAVMKDYDIVCIQEVNKNGGKEGCDALLGVLRKNYKTQKWENRVSQPTTGDGTECYAFFWKSKKIKLNGEPFLEKTLEKTIDREPFLIRFKIKSKTILIATIHTVPTDKHPAKECTQLYKLDSLYAKDRLLICGDLNLSQSSDEGFKTLKDRGCKPSITGQKTSLKQKEKEGECLSQEYDNIFYDASFTKKSSSIVDLTAQCSKLAFARSLSDHLPVFGEFKIVK